MSIWADAKKFLGFGREEKLDATFTLADSLMSYVISLVNREDLIADQIKAYEKARKLPDAERLDALIPLYIELEKFILANKQLIVKKEFTSESLHESIAKQVPLGKIEEPFRLLFLPENEKLFAFYNVVLGFPFKYFTDIIGKNRLLETVNKVNSGTILSEADFDGEKFYLSTEAIGRLPRGKIVSAFRKLNKSLYREIASLIGKEKADLVANEAGEFVKDTYGQEFIILLTQISSGFGQGRPLVTVTPAAFEMLSDIGLGRVVTEGLVKNVGGELITKGGAALPVSVTASTLQDEAGNVTGIVVAAKDMSEIQALQREKLEILEKSKVELARKVEERTKELEKANIEILKSNKRLQEVAQKLTIAQIELEKSISEKGEFMNIAAHELRSPLQPIIGYADRMLQSGRLNDWQKERTNIILKNAKNLLQLVQDVLDINKMETGIMKFTMEEIDLLSLLKEVHESFKPTVEGKKLKFILDVPKTLGKIHGDSQRLTQVFSNLIVNATKFSDAGSITLKASEEEDTFIISIIDTGVGIDEADIPKIFTKFFQADSSLNRRKRGTGLGLAICKEIIKFHKGKISVESTPGKGSVFKVVLPKNV